MMKPLVEEQKSEKLGSSWSSASSKSRRFKATSYDSFGERMNLEETLKAAFESYSRASVAKLLSLLTRILLGIAAVMIAAQIK